MKLFYRTATFLFAMMAFSLFSVGSTYANSTISMTIDANTLALGVLPTSADG